MKTIKYFILTLFAVLMLTMSCEDDRELIPVWEYGVNGEGIITSTAKDFKSSDPSVNLDVNLKWISVDGNVTITKIDVFFTWKEAYIDLEGNPAVATIVDRTPLVSFEGSEVPANREAVSFSLSQNSLYSMLNGVTFDYGDGNGEVDVWGNPHNVTRNTGLNIFVPEDSFTITWQFTGDDGRVFKAWSPSVCTEFPQSNCQLDFGIVCAESIENPAGDWRFDMVDTYGDGWQGGYIGIIIDGVEADKAFLLSEYDPGGVPISSGTQIVNVPVTATSLHFEWNDDTYNAECQFKIISPKGNVVADVKTVSAGEIKLDLCKE